MNKLFSWCRKKMTKENMIVLALSGVLLMVVAIPTGKEKNKTDESKSVQLDTQTVTMDSESNSAQQEAMEEKLAQFFQRLFYCFHRTLYVCFYNQWQLFCFAN